MNYKIKFRQVLHTDGKTSYWSCRKAAVQCIGLELRAPSLTFGELKVYFTKKTWDPEKYGLIYTDNKFEKELQKALTKLGYAGHNVTYSEQGMQGQNYVSCDVGEEFIESVIKKHEIKNTKFEWDEEENYPLDVGSFGQPI